MSLQGKESLLVLKRHSGFIYLKTTTTKKPFPLLLRLRLGFDVGLAQPYLSSKLMQGPQKDGMTNVSECVGWKWDGQGNSYFLKLMEM